MGVLQTKFKFFFIKLAPPLFRQGKCANCWTPWAGWPPVVWRITASLLVRRTCGPCRGTGQPARYATITIPVRPISCQVVAAGRSSLLTASITCDVGSFSVRSGLDTFFSRFPVEIFTAPLYKNSWDVLSYALCLRNFAIFVLSSYVMPEFAWANKSFFGIFFGRARVCWPLLCLCRPFCSF